MPEDFLGVEGEIGPFTVSGVDGAEDEELSFSERASEETIRPTNVCRDSTNQRSTQAFKGHASSSTASRLPGYRQLFNITQVPDLIRSHENEPPRAAPNGIPDSVLWRLSLVRTNDPVSPEQRPSQQEGKRPARDQQKDSVGDAGSPAQALATLEGLANVTDVPSLCIDGTSGRTPRPKGSSLAHNLQYVAASRNRQPVQQPPTLDPISRWSSSSSDSSVEDANWRQLLSRTFRNLNKHRESTKKTLRRISARGSQIIDIKRKLSLKRLSFGKDNNESTPPPSRRTLFWFSSRHRSTVTSPPDAPRDSIAPITPTTPTNPAKNGSSPVTSPDSGGSASAIPPRPRTPAPRSGVPDITPVRQRRQMQDDAEYLRRRMNASQSFRDQSGEIFCAEKDAPESGDDASNKREAERGDGPGGSGWI